MGSRHLQGLKGCIIPLKIHLFDSNQKAYAFSKERWNEFETSGASHKIIYHKNTSELPGEIDIAIVATTANSRADAILEITKKSKVKFWILEKVLVQNSDSLESIQEFIGDSIAWVNLPRRAVSWHQQIKAKIQSRSPIHLKLAGGPWGLACNSIHFLDMVEWLSSSDLNEVKTEKLQKKWQPAKRNGFFEIYGSLEARFSNGSTAVLTSDPHGRASHIYEITDEKCKWVINEENGQAIDSNGQLISGILPYQSKLTTKLVSNIIQTGTCGLPTLRQSVPSHRVYLKAMLQHWRSTVDNRAFLVPIT